MKQTVHSFLLSLLMSMVGIQAFAHDIEVANVDGKTIYYNFINNNTELAVSCRGTSYNSYSNEYTGNVVIPETVTYNGNTYPVTSIGNYAFSGCSGLTSVSIPSSVTSIGEGAFSYCSGLTSVNIPNSVTSIGDYAFEGCSGLTSVNIPNSVTTIGDYAFYGCSGLKEVHISDLAAWCNISFNSLTSNPLSYAKHLFLNNDEITELTIPNSVTSIGKNAFNSCI